MLPDATMLQEGNPEITGLSTHSGKVKSGDLFVAIRGGEEEDRHPFVAKAVAAGAAAAVVEESVPGLSAPIVKVDSTRRAIGCLANRYYDAPTDSLRMVGITGTNGKTSTAYLIHAILNASGWQPGLISTVEHDLGHKRIPSDNSTPESHDLQRMFHEMVGAGCRSAVMEVSSHGLALDRVFGIEFEAAVFTNLTRDHLDFHGTTAAYLAAKARLFDNLSTDANAVVNLDDAATQALLKNCKSRVVGFGISPSAQVRFLEGKTDWRGTRMKLETPSGMLNLELDIKGRFQQWNVTAAVATGVALGIDPQVILKAVASVKGVPGRFEGIDQGQPFGVIVDYAHTSDGLENVLLAARDLTEGNLICVFGCGGDRDTGKRPEMGGFSATLADFTIVTSDNPRTEDPEAIIQEILPGLGSAPHIVEPDRLMAIRNALERAKPEDLILIAGKGHEDYQIIGREKIHFDDREVAREILTELYPT